MNYLKKFPLTIHITSSFMEQNASKNPVTKDYMGFYTIKEIKGNKIFTFEFADNYPKNQFGEIVVKLIGGIWDYPTEGEKVRIYMAVAIVLREEGFE